MEHGKQFREAAYKLAGLAQPAPWRLGGAPNTITLMSAVTGEMVHTHIHVQHKWEWVSSAFCKTQTGHILQSQRYGHIAHIVFTHY